MSHPALRLISRIMNFMFTIFSWEHRAQHSAYSLLAHWSVLLPQLISALVFPLLITYLSKKEPANSRIFSGRSSNTFLINSETIVCSSGCSIRYISFCILRVNFHYVKSYFLLLDLYLLRPDDPLHTYKIVDILVDLCFQICIFSLIILHIFEVRCFQPFCHFFFNFMLNFTWLIRRESQDHFFATWRFTK